MPHTEGTRVIRVSKRCCPARGLIGGLSAAPAMELSQTTRSAPLGSPLEPLAETHGAPEKGVAGGGGAHPLACAQRHTHWRGQDGNQAR